jgi:chromosome segregation ATPase
MDTVEGFRLLYMEKLYECREWEDKLSRVRNERDELKRKVAKLQGRTDRAVATATEQMAGRHAHELAERHKDSERARVGYKTRIDKLELEIKDVETTHQLVTTRLKEESESKLASRQLEYTNHLGKLKDKQAAMKARWQEDEARLKSALLGNERDNQAWNNEKLKIKFRDIQQLIDNTLSPFQLRVDPGKLYQCRLEDDVMQLLHQRGRQSRDLGSLCTAVVKCSLWRILQRSFFGEAFGFGALGPGDGKDMLMAVYRDWRRLLSSGARDYGSYSNGKAQSPCQLTTN